MNITLFTSNNKRHKYFINLLSKVSKKLYVVQENAPLTFNNQNKSKLKKKYYKKLNIAQSKFFKNNSSTISKRNVKILSLKSGDLKNCSLEDLSDFLKSDIYILFGCSYIKGKLLDFLVKKKGISLHMGLSPYYIGSDCNFWAMYDNNPHLVGATIHYVSKKYDSGPILYHAMSKIKTSVFEYSMSTTKSCLNSLAQKIKEKSIFKLKASYLKRKEQIRNTTKEDFNDKIISNFFKRKIDLKSKDFDLNLLKNPYFLK